MIKLELGGLGIIDTGERIALEDYVDSRAFRQRKQFAEYYVDWQDVNLELDIRDLMILAERFKVTVHEQSVSLTCKN